MQVKGYGLIVACLSVGLPDRFCDSELMWVQSTRVRAAPVEAS